MLAVSAIGHVAHVRIDVVPIKTFRAAPGTEHEHDGEVCPSNGRGYRKTSRADVPNIHGWSDGGLTHHCGIRDIGRPARSP